MIYYHPSIVYKTSTMVVYQSYNPYPVSFQLRRSGSSVRRSNARCAGAPASFDRCVRCSNGSFYKLENSPMDGLFPGKHLAPRKGDPPTPAFHHDFMIFYGKTHEFRSSKHSDSPQQKLLLNHRVIIRQQKKHISSNKHIQCGAP